jgi:hypothetical protein
VYKFSDLIIEGEETVLTSSRQLDRSETVDVDAENPIGLYDPGSPY